MLSWLSPNCMNWEMLFYPQWIWWKEMIVESSARKVTGFPDLASCYLDQDDQKWRTRFIPVGMGPLELGYPFNSIDSLFFLSFSFFFLLLILNLSDPSLSARYSADVKTDVPVVLLYFVTDWVCMTLEISSDSVSNPETKLLDWKGEHAGRGIPTYFAYTSLIMIDSRQMGLMTCAHWADISGILYSY